MSERTIQLAELTRTEINELAPGMTVVQPVGATEQHGPDLPVCVDTALVDVICLRAVSAARATVPIVAAPVLPYGFSHHHLPFGGTVSVGAATYLELLTDLGESLAGAGFRRIVFLNGHGGNETALRLAVDRLVHERGLDAHVAAAGYWTLAGEVVEAVRATAPAPGHAGAFETSLLLAVRPDLVRVPASPPRGEVYPIGRAEASGQSAHLRRAGAWAASDGRSDDAAGADPQVGARLLAQIVDAVAEFLVAFHRSVDDRPDHG